jgi:hypothetical protein
MAGITDAIEANSKKQVREKTEHQLNVEETVRNPITSMFLLGGFFGGK